MKFPKKLIEVALPLPEINDASAYDKMPGIGPHPKGIHHWWARLPLPTARAVLFASVVDDPSSHPDKFPTEEAQNAERERLFNIIRELMQKKLHQKPEVYAKANKEMLKYTGGKLPPMLDPFAGGGSIPLEAARLGFEAHAADLNPVAVLLNKCNLELVPRWLDHPPVNPKTRGEMLNEKVWKGAEGLAEDVRYYGNLIRERAIEKIGHLYPKVHIVPNSDGSWRHATDEEITSGKSDVREANVIAWLWARTVASPNPASQGAHVPLISTYWLSSKKGNLVWLKPVVNKETYSWWFEVKTGEPPDRQAIRNGTKIGRGAQFMCLLSDTPMSDMHIRTEISAKRSRNALIAIVADLGRGCAYIAGDEMQSFTAKSVKPDWKPQEEMNENDPNIVSGRGYGIKKWAELFTPRQLTAMTTFSDLIMELGQDVVANARKARISEFEAVDYAKVVCTFLGLALGRCADFNNGLCRWESIRQEIKNLFSRQAIPMIWDFVEGNPLFAPRSGFDVCVNRVVESLITISPVYNGKVSQMDAANYCGVDRLLVSTDPPYYDNIGYASLSDFFYVWLRRTIGDLHPDLFKTILVPKKPELTAMPDRFDGDRGKAREHFETGFRRTFSNLQEKMDPNYPLTIYYAFKQEDAGSTGVEEGTEANNGVDRTTGWETLLNALIGSGFQITATWPVRASQKQRQVAMGTNALVSYIVLACRPRPTDAPQRSRREFLTEMKKELPIALKHLQQGNIAPVDLAQAAIGPGMAVFSRYTKVLEASGNPMTVRTALALINQTLDEALAEQEAEFDANTRWALAWFDQQGMEEGEFGLAETLSRAKNTAISTLVQTGIIVAQSGKVRLLRRDELPTERHPTPNRRLSVWQTTQYLIHALDQQGESGAAALLHNFGGTTGEVARELAYRLYKTCEKNSWSNEALAYNSLVMAWPELTKLAQIKPSAEQGGLFG